MNTPYSGVVYSKYSEYDSEESTDNPATKNYDIFCPQPLTHAVGTRNNNVGVRTTVRRSSQRLLTYSDVKCLQLT
jgi:hypothetical protein